MSKLDNSSLFQAYEGDYYHRKATGKPIAIPDVPEPRLTTARKRYAAALAEQAKIDAIRPEHATQEDQERGCLVVIDLLVWRRELEASERERITATSLPPAP